MILLIDNYDSFVHNLARHVRSLGAATEIIRNDACTAEEILDSGATGIVLSPGPCTPDDAGVCLDLVARAKHRMPVLGICLGHQTIGQAHGATVRRAGVPMHGKASLLHHDGRGIFMDIPTPVPVGRYHSLVIDLPEKGPLVETAHTNERDGSRTVMGIAHRTYPQVGLQFHPESVLSAHGSAYLDNFLTFAGNWQAARKALKDAAQ